MGGGHKTVVHEGREIKSVATFGSSLPATGTPEPAPPFSETPKIIPLRERSFPMLKKDLILRNPLRLLGQDPDSVLPAGGFGAITARAGVGKTAFMIQIALNSQLEGKNVLHISLNDPVKKVDLWYKEVFRLLAEQYNVGQINQLWETILPHRFIMTFRVEGFGASVLDERLNDLIDQDIFYPQMIIIDGMPFDEDVRGPLADLKALALARDLRIWFTVRTHRHEEPGPEGVPVPLVPVFDLFEAAIGLQPEGKKIHVVALKGAQTSGKKETIYLDPSTMLIKEK